MNDKCYFCGQVTNGKTFQAKTETDEVKTFSVCDDCDDSDLHEDTK